MKLSFFILTITFLNVFANSSAQTVTLTAKDLSYTKIFKEVKKQTGYVFFYNQAALEKLSPGNIDVHNMALPVFLEKIFSVNNLKYHISGTTIIVSRKPVISIPPSEPSLQQDTYPLTGNVVDEKGQPVPGATIRVAGNTLTTITDGNGKFSLKLNSPTETLIISSVGFSAKTIKLNGESVINVQLNATPESINEVVVIGYGTAKKKDLTGSVVRLNTAQFETQTINSVNDMLRGTVPGLNTTVGTSAKGTAGFEIRGTKSLKASNAPLIVVDGMIFYGDVTDINPNDIQSFDILKDASAAAVYGSRAASGVILITTKKGTKALTIDYNGTLAISKVGMSIKPRTPEQYLQQRQDANTRLYPTKPAGYYANPQELPAGVSLDQWRMYDISSGLSDKEIWLNRIGLAENEIQNALNNKTINWFDEVYKPGLRNDQNISISGKSDKTSYYVSLGYLDNQGIIWGDRFKTFRSRVNLDIAAVKFLNFGVNAQFSNRNESALSADEGLVRYASPYGDKYNADGSYNWYPNNDVLAANPFLAADPRISKKLVNQALLANIYAELKLPAGISYRVNWINRIANQQDYIFYPSTVPAGLPGGAGSRTDSKSVFWTVDNILSWKRNIGKAHFFDLTLLYSVEKQNAWSSQMSNSNFLPNQVLDYSGLQNGSNPILSIDDNVKTGDAAMARLNYALWGKYLLTASVRRDGYSAFGQKNPRAYFPAAALAWRISDESFMKQISVISDLKLRLSWGANGNREIGQYAALSQLNSTKYIYGNNSVTGVYTINMANTNLKWEETYAYNAGLDFGLFNDRLSGSAEAYYMSTRNLILDRSLPPILGYASVISNLGEVQNKGIEVNLRSLNIDNKNFVWNTGLIFTLNRNKLVHLYGTMQNIVDANGKVIGQREADDRTNGWYINQALDRIYDYKVLGIWQQNQRAAAAKYKLEPGDFRLLDVNGDSLMVPLDDKIFQGYTKPRYRLSLSNDFRIYKNFGISFLITANLDYWGASNLHRNSDAMLSRANNYNVPYWTPDNPINDYARLQAKEAVPVNYYVKRSFVRLQTMSVSYTFPQRLLKSMRLSRLQAFLNMQNTVTLTGWDSWDPETAAPTPAIYSFGINASL